MSVVARKLKARRRALLAGQGGECYYCRRPLADGEATLDHKMPRSRGGTDAARNLVAACRRCNLDKGDRIWQTR